MSKKRSIRGKSNHGAILRQPCRCCLKCTCTRSLCENWHPPECPFYKTQTGCKAGDKCLFPHKNNQTKSQRKAIFHHKRRESDDNNAVAIVKIVPQLGCVSQDSEALVSQGRKSWGNPMQRVLEPIQRVRFTESALCQASIREKKGPSLGKLQVKLPHQRSPIRCEILRTGPMKRLKDNSDVPEARHGTLPKTFTSSKKKTRLLWKNGYCGLHQ